MDFTLSKADKKLFALYHMLYSGADIEMWFDWDKRLGDTEWTDECFFIISDGRKIGGAIIIDGIIHNAFLITPFSDRAQFWRFLIEVTNSGKIIGVLDADVCVLLSLGYRIDRIGQVMCRPADNISVQLSKGFSCRALELDRDAKEAAGVLVRSYAGGICDEINGPASAESAEADLREVCDIYSKFNWSMVVTDDASGKIAGLCLAGVGKNYAHGYGEVAELCVLPEYRCQGLAKYMLAEAVTSAVGIAPFIKLFVYVGNNAEYLYRQMGFVAGVRFTNMTRR